jgi:hypothetical protein
MNISLKLIQWPKSREIRLTRFEQNNTRFAEQVHPLPNPKMWNSHCELTRPQRSALSQIQSLESYIDCIVGTLDDLRHFLKYHMRWVTSLPPLSLVPLGGEDSVVILDVSRSKNLGLHWSHSKTWSKTPHRIIAVNQSSKRHVMWHIFWEHISTFCESIGNRFHKV